MSNPKISIVMGVYNGEKYMDTGIQSIINQTFQDWEFIICDDGSTDGTYEKLLQYAMRDDRIKIIRNAKNQGLAYSLNNAILHTKSNILARQDADDRSELNRFELQYPFVCEHPEYAIVGTAWNNIDASGNLWITMPKEKPLAKDLIWDGGFMHPSWMMRKDMLEKVGFYTVSDNTKRDQDYHLVMKLYGAGMKMYNIQIPLYNYTNDSATFSRTKNKKLVKGLMWIRWDGYRRNKFPVWDYVFVLKPLLKNILPTSITRAYYLRGMK